MAVAFDAKSTSVIAANGVTSFTDSTKMTVGGGSNTALLVMISWSQFTTSITVTWGGTAMTRIGLVSSPATTANIALYALRGPTAGAQTLSCTWTGSADVVASAVSFTGVDQTSDAIAFAHRTTNSGSASPVSDTITSATGNMVAAIFCSGNFVGSSPVFTMDHTTIFTGIGSNGLGCGANMASGAASVALGGTYTFSADWAGAGVDLVAAAGGVTLPWVPLDDGSTSLPWYPIDVVGF